MSGPHRPPGHGANSDYLESRPGPLPEIFSRMKSQLVIDESR